MSADPWFTDADVEAVALIIGTVNARTRHVYDANGNDACLTAARAVLTSLAPRIAQERADALRETADFLDRLKAESISPPWLRARADVFEREAGA